MAPPTRRRKADAAAAAAPVIDPADRLSNLPNSILAEIMTYLTDQEAVRTCVLARTWRHLWKFTTRLIITGDSVQEVRSFVDGLLRARLAGLVDGVCGSGGGGGSIEVCKIKFRAFEDKDVPIVNRWIRLAVACRVQRLKIGMWRPRSKPVYGDSCFRMSKSLLVSPHLTSLYLSGIWFSCEYLDFSGCPALERLEIHCSSMLCLRKMTSLSVRHLDITNIECSQGHRFRICFPRLVSLRLEDIFDRSPVLESMPELEEAYVEIYSSYVDYCSCDDRMGCEHVMGDVHSSDSEVDSDTEEGQNTTKCVLLDGLSQARDLQLMSSDQSMYILRRDLKWCPIFSKLKTLLLNDYWWCEPADCRALVCILQHAPVLEELTVIFSLSPNIFNVEFKGHPQCNGGSNIMLQCLKEVKVKCKWVDEQVLSILNYLETLNIRFQKSSKNEEGSKQLS